MLLLLLLLMIVLLLLLLLLQLRLLWVHLVLLGLSVHLGLLAVLRIDGDRGSANLQRTIVAAAGHHVVALVAAVLGVLEPVGAAGHASQAGADETEEDTDEAVSKDVSSLDLFYMLSQEIK